MALQPRTGQSPPNLERDEFQVQFHKSFVDLAFIAVRDELARVEEVAWNNYLESHKVPFTEKGGSRIF